MYCGGGGESKQVRSGKVRGLLLKCKQVRSRKAMVLPLESVRG
jgi:hypothetical protein